MKSRTRLQDGSLLSLLSNDQDVYIKTYEVKEYHLYLDDEVLPPASYRESFNALREASYLDNVFIHINTGGGDASSMHQWINHINACDADVIGIIHNYAYSAGSAIALACNDWQIFPSTELMIHNISFSGEGKDRDVVDSVIFTSNQARNFVQRVYQGFLTPKEIEKVYGGRDLYFDSDEVVARLSRYKIHREKELKKKEKADARN